MLGNIQVSMETQSKYIVRDSVIPKIWIRRFNSFLPKENNHPCINACEEPCRECLDYANSFSFMAKIVLEQDDELSRRLNDRANDYNWKNGSPAPNEPPPMVVNAMSVPQQPIFTNAVSKKKA